MMSALQSPDKSSSRLVSQTSNLAFSLMSYVSSAKLEHPPFVNFCFARYVSNPGRSHHVYTHISLVRNNGEKGSGRHLHHFLKHCQPLADSVIFILFTCVQLFQNNSNDFVNYHIDRRIHVEII